MDKFQAIFEILCCLSAADGEVHPNEVDVINNFLNANFGKINFNPKSVASSLGSLTYQGLMDEMVRAAIVFKNTSTAKDRTTVLDFALDLIAADGIITKEESILFFALGNRQQLGY